MKDIFKYVFFFILLINSTISHHPQRFCGGFIGTNPKIIYPINKIDEDEEVVLKASPETEWKEISIFLDTNHFEEQAGNNETLRYIVNLTKKAATQATNILQKLIKVKNHPNYHFDDSLKSLLYISKWNTTYFGGTDTIFPSDLAIFFIFISPLGMELASSNCPVKGEENRCIGGYININKDRDYTKDQKELELLTTVLIHETFHILGLNMNFYQNYFPKNPILIKKDKYGIERTFITSTRVVDLARKYFNCPTAIGIELDNIDAQGHWESRIMRGDIMTPIIYPEEEVISEFTLALLEDSGWYKVNYYTGGLMRFGKGKGCDFLNNKCVEKGKVVFTNEYFNKDNIGEQSCSSGRQSRAHSELYQYNNDEIPSEYNYFNKNSGGRQEADYCPIFFSKEIYEELYTSNCRIGNNNYGPQIYANKKSLTSDIINRNVFPSTLGEKYGDNSFCALSTLAKNSDLETYDFTSKVRAMCYPMFCSNSRLTIQINDDYYVCPNSGGKVKVDGYEGYLMCPDFNLICTGTVMCNNMYDCVNKESRIKLDAYTYDYKIQNTQMINEINDLTFVEDYEAATNGVCSQYCKQCSTKSKCTICGEGYTLKNEECIKK